MTAEGGEVRIVVAGQGAGGASGGVGARAGETTGEGGAGGDVDDAGTPVRVDVHDLDGVGGELVRMGRDDDGARGRRRGAGAAAVVDDDVGPIEGRLARSDAVREPGGPRPVGVGRA